MQVNVVEKKEGEGAGIFRRMQYEISNIGKFDQYGMEELRREAFRDFVPFLKKYKAQDIIDIGCGRGYESKFLAKRGFNVTDLDIQRRQTTIVQKSAKEKRLDIDVILGDAIKLPVGDGKFDAALSLAVMVAFKSDERMKAVSEMERVLRSGGLILVILASDDKAYSIKLRNDDGSVTNMEKWQFSEKDMREMFQNFEFLLLKKVTVAYDKNFWILVAKKMA
ncbi:class I SAM-dependent methyltransferase [Candidatus Micrarchaeota archaeon]|nr:class I SAM-dependent methyltransferase [Candidatus Micrarchaeota archaeon]